MKETYEFKPVPKKNFGGAGSNAANMANDKELFKRMSSERTEPVNFETRADPVKKVTSPSEAAAFYREYINIGKTKEEVEAEIAEAKRKKELEEKAKREAEQKEYQERWGDKLEQYERIIKESSSEPEQNFARMMYGKITGKPYGERKK